MKTYCIDARTSNAVANYLGKSNFDEDDILTITPGEFMRSRGVGRSVWQKVREAQELILNARSAESGDKNVNLYQAFMRLQDRVCILENKLKGIGQLL